MEEERDPRQFELKLYDQRCSTGYIKHCGLCRDIAQKRFPFTLRADIGLFQASSAQCTTCAAIYDSVKGLPSSAQKSWKSMEIRFNACSDTSRFYASELILSDDAGWSKFQLFTELGQHDGTTEPVIGAARSISSESNSRQCFDVIRRWISDCDKHPACAASLGSPNPPTRLLDVWVGDDVVRLHVTHGEVDPYIALSHCWGPDGLPDSAKTTRATLDSRRQGIQINTLPKTFRDAISICRELGVRFLWVDSLCIIQQDAEDWEKECSRMRDIYRNSYLTISVTRSRDSSEGCFSTRKTRHLSTKVGNIEHQGKSCDVLSRESISHDEMGSSDSVSSQSFPLFSRAWTFQERLLPRRVVHYGALELIWECNTLSDCECAASQELLAGWEWQRGPKVLFSEIMSQPRQGPQFRQKLAVLLRRFSLMKLSFDSDRLPSLSGISQALKCEETGEYLAGLWEKELSWMIGWINMGNDACRPSCKPAPPTWSWMSLENSWMSWNYSQDLSQHGEWATAWPNGRDLAVRNTTFEMLIVRCTIKSASCIPWTKHDVFGRVASGILSISGRIAPATLRDDHFCERNEIKQRFIPDVRSEAHLYEPGQMVHCLMIGMMSEKSNKYPGLVVLSSLVLKARDQEPKNPPRYERIGIMLQNNHFAWKEAPAWWEGAGETVVDIV